MLEKIPIKFHIEGNKIIFDEMWMLLIGDKVIIEHTIDDKGEVHYTRVWIERRVRSIFGDN